MFFSLYPCAEKTTKKRNLCHVYLRISSKGIRTLVKTKLDVSPFQWDDVKQKVANNALKPTN